MTKDTDTEKCTGLMEVSIKVNGQKEFSMGMERCTFQMDQRRLASLKIMYSREDLSIHILIKSLQ